MKSQKYFHYICYMYNIGELYMGIRIFYVPQLLGIFLACHSIISFTYIHVFAQFSYIVSEISTTYLTTKLHVRPTTYPHITFPCSISKYLLQTLEYMYYLPPIYLHLIFPILQFEISSLINWIFFPSLKQTGFFSKFLGQGKIF